MTNPTLAPPFRSYALELHAVQHCNLTCHGCSQSSALLGPAYEDLDIMERALRNLAGALACQKLQVLGGEPLLHPRIVDVLRIAADSGLAPVVAVKTNGLLLPRMPVEFWKLATLVIVSVYPATERRLGQQRDRLAERAEANGTELIFRPFETFRQITKSSATSSPVLVTHVFQRCGYKKFTHSLRSGRLYRCAPSVNLAAACGLPECDSDSMDALSPSGLPARLRDFLSSELPLEACRHCLGSSGAPFRHRVNHQAQSLASAVGTPNDPDA